MTVIDGQSLDRALAERLGARAAALLGILPAHPTKQERKDLRLAPDWMRIVRHRVLALLATLEVIKRAQVAGLPNALFLEGDVRPVPSNMLTSADIDGLRSYLGSRPWELVRPSGYFYDFAQYRRRANAAKCPSQCKCEPTGLSRACLVPRAKVDGASAPTPGEAARRRPVAAGELLAARCDVRDTVGFAVHARTYPTFRRLRRAALQAVGRMASHANQTRPLPANSSFGWSVDRFDESLPWFDKWLPARFNSLYVLPSIVVQQVRQGDEKTSAMFKARCMRP